MMHLVNPYKLDSLRKRLIRELEIERASGEVNSEIWNGCQKAITSLRKEGFCVIDNPSVAMCFNNALYDEGIVGDYELRKAYRLYIEGE